MSNVFNNITQFTIKQLGKIKPTLSETNFLEKGVLTPDEFVEAGDLLVLKCPGQWKWLGGLEKKQVNYLPSEKQFLMTCEPVSCRERFKKGEDGKRDEIVEDDWLAITSTTNEEDNVIIDADDMGKNSNKNIEIDKHDSESDIPDMESFDEENNLIEKDPAAENNQNSLIKSRKYNLTICYDNYYHTPKLWLCGYDEDGSPLTPEEMFMDISADHVNKTVTLDEHPHIGEPFAYIHPCKHAAVMKKFIDVMIENGNPPRVDKYLFIFLKFLGAVIPTISYDSTFEIGF